MMIISLQMRPSCAFWSSIISRRTTAQVLPLLLWFLVHVNVLVLALSKLIETEGETVAADEKGLSPTIQSLLEARLIVTENGAQKQTFYSALRKIRYDAQADTAMKQRTPLFPGTRDESSNSKSQQGDEIIMVERLQVQREEGNIKVSAKHDERETPLGSGTFGRAVRVSYTTDWKAWPAQNHYQERVMKHVAISLSHIKGKELKRLLALLGETAQVGTRHNEVGTSFFVGDHQKSEDENNANFRSVLLWLFDGDTTEAVAMALKEAYVALDISSRPEEQRQCCVPTNSVRVAFSETVKSIGQEGILNAHFLFEMPSLEMNLHDFLTQQVPVSPPLLQSLFMKEITAVQGMHSLGWVHGDVKLENFLVEGKTETSDSEDLGTITVKLADFGLSSPVSLERTKDDGGSFYYMDPRLLGDPLKRSAEPAKPKAGAKRLPKPKPKPVPVPVPEPVPVPVPVPVPQAHACDIWSLGIVQHEMVSYFWKTDDASHTKFLRESIEYWKRWRFEITRKLEDEGGVDPLQNGFHKWWAVRAVRAAQGSDADDHAALNLKETDFPPPFNTISHDELLSACQGNRPPPSLALQQPSTPAKPAVNRRQHGYPKRQRPADKPKAQAPVKVNLSPETRKFLCFMLALQKHALHHDYKKRNLDKLGMSLKALSDENYAGVVSQQASLIEMTSPNTNSLASSEASKTTLEKEDLHGTRSTSSDTISASSDASRTTTSNDQEDNHKQQSTSSSSHIELDPSSNVLVIVPEDSHQSAPVETVETPQKEAAHRAGLTTDEHDSPKLITNDAAVTAESSTVDASSSGARANVARQKKTTINNNFNAFLELQGFVRSSKTDNNIDKEQVVATESRPSVLSHYLEASEGIWSGLVEL
ncbi:unnamed protein product [Amoebophrya sp. A25]|nr:unnamed protein product [Amoebophrya sp. A25]|eukprot:GSA25T00012653001.1